MGVRPVRRSATRDSVAYREPRYEARDGPLFAGMTAGEHGGRGRDRSPDP